MGSPKAEQEAVVKANGNHMAKWIKDESEEVRGKFRTKGFWLGKYPVTQREWLR